MKPSKIYDTDSSLGEVNMVSDFQESYILNPPKSKRHSVSGQDWLDIYLLDLGISEYLKSDQSIFALSPLLNNSMAVSLAIGKGLPLESLHDFKHKSGLDIETIAGILDITSRSIRRYNQGDTTRLRPDTSERLFGLIEIFELGIEVFGDRISFKNWLQLESIALGDSSPISLLRDGYGRQLVKAELVRIDHGIFA